MDQALLGDTSFGILALLPPLVAIFLAFKTKNVYISLATGLYSGVVMLIIFNYFVNGDLSLWLLPFSLLAALIQIPIYLTNTLGDPWNGGIVLQVLFIGGVIHLLTYSGGSKAIASKIASYAKDRSSAQFYTWVMGLVVFFDDYANALIVGPIMRPVMDQMKISREKLAFIIDATAAPIAGLAIISTWIGYELGLIQSGLDVIGLDMSPFALFFQTIPFRFYNILMLGFILLTIYTKREFGPMLEVEQMAARGEKTPGMLAEEDIKSDFTAQKEGIHSNLWDGVLPIVTLVVGALVFFYISGISELQKAGDFVYVIPNNQNFFTHYLDFTLIQDAFSNANAAVVLFQAATFTLIIMFIRAKLFNQFTVTEGIDVFMGGAKSLLSTVFILLFAWSLGGIVSDLGASAYLVNALSDTMPYFLLPALVFMLSGFIAFSTGTSFGTMGILMPIVIPLAYAIMPDLGFLTLSISAVLTGATFGDHCSPISDTTILSSAGAGCDHIEHVRTQMPYAFLVGVVSTFCYFLATFTVGMVTLTVTIGLLTALTCLVLGMLALYVYLRLRGTVVQ